jgi:hypothetical protein
MSIRAETTRRSTQVDAEEIETTRSEKLLAFVLAAFLLVGGLWVYFNLDDIDRPTPGPSAFAPEVSEAGQGAIQRHERAERRLFNARRSEQAARGTLELRREAYRTALDAGEPSAALERSYLEAQSRFRAVQRRTRQAAATEAAARPAAQAAQRRLSAAEERRFKEQEERASDHRRNTFLLRLVYVILTIGLGYWLLGRVRRRHPRYLSVGLAFVGFAAMQALVMTVDYTSDYVEYDDAGLLAISIAGTAMTLGGLVALQRYIRKRVPQRRVRKRECPFCGYPVRDNERCEGCGRDVISECATCSNRRRVGTAHCGACGAA